MLISDYNYVDDKHNYSSYTQKDSYVHVAT